jgi:threonine aldolase
MMYPPTTLMTIENTHNRAGGVVIPAVAGAAVAAVAAEHGVATYLDGARLWNAAAAEGIAVGALAAPFDLVSVALSKGLGAPGGSLLAGSVETIARAVRYRRMAGGAMRQVGIFAAAGEYALDHHFDRLADDHANARLIAEALAENPGVELDPAAVRTSIIVFRLTSAAPDAATVVSRARDAGVLVVAFGPRTIRAVTHLDVSRADCVAAARILVAAIA